MQRFMGIGNTTRDVEVINTTTGTSMVKFGIAIRRNFKNKDTDEYDADFLNCVAFGKTADIIEKYVKKGNKVGIVGRIQTGSYEAQDGTKRYTTDIVVEEVELLTPKGDSVAKQARDNDLSELVAVPDGDMPF